MTHLLHMMPTGEHRPTYLSTCPGQGEAVRDYYNQTWPGKFAFIDRNGGGDGGLFGPGRQHPRLVSTAWAI